MALLVFSSPLANSSNIYPLISSFNYKPSTDWNSVAGLMTPAKCSRVSHTIHPLVLSSPSSLGKSILPKSDSKRFANSAWKPPIYVYPDPNPEFAREETQKFRVELMRRLLKNKETFGKDIEEVVGVCSEIFGKFLHKEYGGPGTFLVEPFTDMLLALKARKLSGAPVAARTALLWAQNHVDKDWEIWASNAPK